jgi:hypothetical protein
MLLFYKKKSYLRMLPCYVLINIILASTSWVIKINGIHIMFMNAFCKRIFGVGNQNFRTPTSTTINH